MEQHDRYVLAIDKHEVKSEIMDIQDIPMNDVDHVGIAGEPRCGRWVCRLNAVAGVACGIVLLLAGWKGLKELDFREAARFPDIPALGEVGYGSSFVATIGDLIEREELRGKRLAVWSGMRKTSHGFPFRWRVTADWFLLPEKGVPTVASAEEAAEYEYILSPWILRWELESEGRVVTLVTDENRVWLYRISKDAKEGGAEK